MQVTAMQHKKNNYLPCQRKSRREDVWVADTIVA